jgi:hypothetical protein|tara:strand:- start:4042 stop:4146 length:105 start_codon:yes stop_codon:yes gene_type:complete
MVIKGFRSGADIKRAIRICRAIQKYLDAKKKENN